MASAVFNAYSSKKAGKQAAKAQRRASDEIKSASTQARFDVLSSMPLAQDQLMAGNLMAQDTVARGFNQAHQALLGQSIQPFQSGSADYSNFSEFNLGSPQSQMTEILGRRL